MEGRRLDPQRLHSARLILVNCGKHRAFSMDLPRWNRQYRAANVYPAGESRVLTQREGEYVGLTSSQ
jgi:hypothetical protein